MKAQFLTGLLAVAALIIFGFLLWVMVRLPPM